jgi:Ca2+-binding RTX toxin-like protein
VRFFRNIDSVTTDLGGVETLEFLALGGSDAIVVGELTGTDVTRVGLDLKGSSGSGDGQADRISVNATQGDDLFGAEGENGVIRVFGLSASVEILGAEQAGDLLTLNALAGADVVDATAPGTEGIQLVLNGGLGIDVLLGGEGAEVFSGGDGDDTVLMGGGDDTLVWNPGDDLDTVEGQEGFDTLRFNGSNVSESIDISSSGGRVRFFRNVATVTLDLDDVEAIDFAAQGGSDFILVDDLSGTDVLEVNLALAAVSGTGDAQPDTVFVQGTGGNDSVIVQEDADLVSVLGLPAQVTIKTPEIALDSLHVYPVAGDDVVDASGLSASSIQFVADGGADHDVLIGGDGADVLAGGDGDDVLLGGPGLDVLDGGPGDNIVIQ